MNDRHPGWTVKRVVIEKWRDRTPVQIPSWYSQRRAFADNRRARLREKRALRIKYKTMPLWQRYLNRRMNRRY